MVLEKLLIINYHLKIVTFPKLIYLLSSSVNFLTPGRVE